MLQGWYRRRSLHGAVRRGRDRASGRRSGRPPRDASAQRAPYRRYTFASKMRRIYLARLLRVHPPALLPSPPFLPSSHPCTQWLGIFAN